MFMIVGSIVERVSQVCKIFVRNKCGGKLILEYSQFLCCELSLCGLFFCLHECWL